MMQRFCYHARGIDHIETGDPCQDAFLFARCGRYIVFGGSDGVGSRKHSERGSRLAVASSVLYVASHLTADMTASEVEDVIRSSFSVAYHAVAELARRNGEHPRFHTVDDATLLMVFDPERPPATLDDEYYAEPDWEALRQAAVERARAAWERATRHVRHAGSEARTLGGASADESCAEVSS